MKDNAKIALAVGGGYMLGRTKKAKLAIGLGMWLAGKKINLDPKQLSGLIGQVPALGGLSEQVRGNLVGVGKQAAGAVVTRQAGRLTDSLTRRADALRDGGKPARDHDEADQADEGEPSAEAGEDEQDDQDQQPASSEAKPRRKPRASAEGAAKGARQAASGAGRRTTKAANGATRKASGAAAKGTRAVSRAGRSQRDG